MSKLIFTVHGSQVPAELLDPAFREVLRDAGATAVQINVDDEDVADALRFGPAEPVTAIVSVWADGTAADIVSAVATTAGASTVHGYLVTERIRLDPAPTPEGVRSDVLAQVALLRRPDGMSREAYLNHWMYTHTAIAIRTQNTAAYVQNIVEEALTANAPELSAIVEEHFPMAAIHDPHEFYGSRGDDAEMARRMTELMTSVAAFGADQGLDLVPTSRYQWSL